MGFHCGRSYQTKRRSTWNNLLLVSQILYISALFKLLIKTPNLTRWGFTIFVRTHLALETITKHSNHQIHAQTNTSQQTIQNRTNKPNQFCSFCGPLKMFCVRFSTSPYSETYIPWFKKSQNINVLTLCPFNNSESKNTHLKQSQAFQAKTVTDSIDIELWEQHLAHV